MTCTGFEIQRVSQFGRFDLSWSHKWFRRAFRSSSGIKPSFIDCGAARLKPCSPETCCETRSAIGYPCNWRPRDPAQRDYCRGNGYASVFQQHYPTRERAPRSPKCAEVPHHVSGDNAHSPDYDQQSRGRRQKWQQPQKIPWEYDGRAQKRCCHGPRKCVRSPFGFCDS
jgi:hypothetical protein